MNRTLTQFTVDTGGDTCVARYTDVGEITQVSASRLVGARKKKKKKRKEKATEVEGGEKFY